MKIRIQKWNLALISSMLLVFLLLSSCVTSDGGTSGFSSSKKAPQWMEDKDAVYSPEAYLAEVGEGDSLKAAKSAAAGAIAQIFRTRVTVDMTVSTRYSEITGSDGNSQGSNKTTDVAQTIGQTADQTLANLRYGESWTDSLGRVYVIAYLDRAETGRLYRQRVLDEDRRVSELLDRARQQTDPLRRFAFLDAALVVSEAAGVLLQQLEIIDMPMARATILSNELGALRAAQADQAAGIKVSVQVSGDEDGRIAALLNDWVAEKGFSASVGGDMLLSAVVSMEKVELNNDYENLNWELNLALMDASGYPVVAIPRQGRSSGVSASAAESRAFLDMTKTIQGEFDKEFVAYLDSHLTK